MGLFTWIRNQVRSAVISGFNDALEEMHATAAAEPIAPPVILRLTAPEPAEVPLERKRKGAAS